eukprot:TRINITY_DN92635_c0_g1_i1.p1 TRINITY_DN92635_c0_g1~~TRINITY_DN92635_c0_g1_i1.p1  ORF type:complete len:482 (+),score=37.30 TRINITY_DN92635_c0_g1_i1:130-1575(+)
MSQWYGRDPSPRCCCHYGWVMLLACPLLHIASASGHSFALAPFIDGWMSDVHLSRSTISAFWTCAMLLSAVASPCIGSVIDRLGTHRVVLCCIPVSIGIVLWLSHISSPAGLLIGICINRVISADTLPLCAKIALNRWFIKHRGRASVVLGAATAWLLFFPGIEIQLQAWTGNRQQSYYFIALYVAILACPTALMWRDSPESVGLLPDLTRYEPVGDDSKIDPEDGEKLAVAAGSPDLTPPACADVEVTLTRAEAVQTTMFWAIAISNINNSLLWVGCHFHLMDLFKIKGADSSDAGAFYTTVSIARLAISFSLGIFCLDRFKRRAYLLLVVQAVPQSIVILLLLGLLGPSVWQKWMIVLFALVYGSWGGISTAAGNVVYAQLFGRTHLGSITGFATAFCLAAGALGPEFMGVCKEFTGSYAPVLFFLLVSTQLSTILLLLAPIPNAAESSIQTGDIGPSQEPHKPVGPTPQNQATVIGRS